MKRGRSILKKLLCPGWFPVLLAVTTSGGSLYLTFCTWLGDTPFAAVHVPPRYVLCTVLAVPGFMGWVLPYFLYRKLAAKRAKVVAEQVERKYDEIYEICEQGNQLMN